MGEIGKLRWISQLQPVLLIVGSLGIVKQEAGRITWEAKDYQQD